MSRVSFCFYLWCMEKQDIRTAEDIALLVRTFYGRARTDEVLAPKFVHVDFDLHMPRFEKFWSFILLGDSGYKGNVYDVHVNLGLSHDHFEAWLGHFRATVNELFAGEKAAMALQRAEYLAMIFEHKLREQGKLAE